MSVTVSVIIPAFNVEKFIKETIASVFHQNYTDFEVIVVDDGSNDKTAEIVNSINDKRIRYYYQPNSGLPAKARNTGVKYALGKYLAFLDHDDLWLPDKLLKQIEIIKSDNDVTLISTNAFLMYEDRKTDIPFLKKMKSGYFSENNLIPGNKVIQSTTLVKRDAFEAVGGLNEDPDLMAIEDYDLWLKIYSKYPCYYINECLAYYRILTNSASAGGLKRLERELVHFNKCFDSYDFPDVIKYKRLNNVLFRLAIVQFFLRDQRWRINLRQSFLVKKSVLGVGWYLLSFISHRVAEATLICLRKLLKKDK